MFKITKKLPIGMAALCVVSLFGLKDTGVFVNEHVQTTYSGNKVVFAEGEKIEVIEKAENGYIVAKGKAKVTVPTEKIQLTNGQDIYKVTKNASIKNNDQIIRALFIGEELTLVEDKGDFVVAKCNDGTTGTVAKENLDLVITTKKEPVAVAKAVKEETVEKEAPVEEKVVAVAKAKEEEKIVTMKKAEAEIQKVAMTKVDTKEKAAPANSNVANTAVNSALNKLGSRYVYGATGNGGYDCSGLVYSVYKNELGINIPRSSREQSNHGQQVSKSNLQAGDLIFFNTSGRGVSHVGIYKGNGDFVHASSGQRKVMVSNLSESYYSSRYVNATRVL